MATVLLWFKANLKKHIFICSKKFADPAQSKQKICEYFLLKIFVDMLEFLVRFSHKYKELHTVVVLYMSDVGQGQSQGEVFFGQTVGRWTTEGRKFLLRFRAALF